MRSLIIACTAVVLAGCQHLSNAPGLSVGEPIFVRMDQATPEDGRWPPGIEPPAWYEDGGASAGEAAPDNRAKLAVEAKLFTWASFNDFEEFRRLFRLEDLTDTRFTSLGDRKQRGFASGYPTPYTMLTTPVFVLAEGQSGSRELFSSASAVHPRGGVAIFAKAEDVSGETGRLRVSAQGICLQDKPPAPGCRWPYWTAEGQQTMRFGEWYVKLAESEDPRRPVALVVRVAEAEEPSS